MIGKAADSSLCSLHSIQFSPLVFLPLWYTWDFKEIAICGKAWPCPSAPHLHEERQRRGKVFADTMGPKTYWKSLNSGRIHWDMAATMNNFAKLEAWNVKTKKKITPHFLAFSEYPTRAIITRGLYIYYPIFEGQFFVFKVFFSRKLCPYGLTFKSGLWWRAYGIWTFRKTDLKNFWTHW